MDHVNGSITRTNNTSASSPCGNSYCEAPFSLNSPRSSTASFSTADGTEELPQAQFVVTKCQENNNSSWVSSEHFNSKLARFEYLSSQNKELPLPSTSKGGGSSFNYISANNHNNHESYYSPTMNSNGHFNSKTNDFGDSSYSSLLSECNNSSMRNHMYGNSSTNCVQHGAKNGWNGNPKEGSIKCETLLELRRQQV